MAVVATQAVRTGLRTSAAAVQNFIDACEALRGQIGREVVAEHLDVTLKRMAALRDDLMKRADLARNGDALFVALGVGSAGMGSLAEAFGEMHRRYRATLPGSSVPMGWFDEEDDVEGI